MDEEQIRRRLAGRALEYMMFKDEEEDMDADSVPPDNLILFPDFEKLKEEVEKLRTELSMLLLERDELQFIVCKNIETEYMLRLGGIEYRVYEAECTVLRLKRKIELIQAKKNRQEKVIISVIEETLDNEFDEYKKQLDEQISKMNEALARSKAEALSPEDNKELKRIYRKIVKILHPDINPDTTDSQIKLFDNAVSAYKNGDLETLRIIGEMIVGAPAHEMGRNAMSQLAEERDRLLNMVMSVRESIDKIKTAYPYTMKDIIEDEERIKKKKLELESILEQNNELLLLYKEKLEEILG